MSNKNLGPQIHQLRSEGKSYREIEKQLGCSKGTICYHLGSDQKAKYTIRRHKSRSKEHPFVKKTQWFKYEKPSKHINKKQTYTTRPLISSKINLFCSTRKGAKTMNYNKQNFTVDDVINKFEHSQQCYLTGDKIDINQPRSYHFDHVIPVSRGGDNSIDNLQLATKQANQAKGNMTPDEFLFFCKKVLEHHGFDITKK
jgi:5-methylcytosine-specific restriction endonuclease McrA